MEEQFEVLPKCATELSVSLTVTPKLKKIVPSIARASPSGETGPYCVVPSEVSFLQVNPSIFTKNSWGSFLELEEVGPPGD